MGCLSTWVKTYQRLILKHSKIKRRSRTYSAKVVRKSSEHRPKNDEKLTTNRPKSRKNRRNFERAVLGAQGRFGDVLGGAQDGSETPKNHPRADLGAPRASQELPGVVQKRPMAGPETHLGRTGMLPERVRHIEPRQTRSRNDFATFLRRHAKARSLKFVRPRSVS